MACRRWFCHWSGERLGNFVRRDKKLEFHLLEFARTENVIARSDLVSKGLADLANAEWDFLAGGFEDVLELDENRLSGFGTEICNIVFALDWPDVRLQHQIERARLGEE